jgi:carbon starvation protein
MNSVILMITTFILYIVAYHTYGRYLSSKIFSLNKEAKTPSHTQRDDIDFIPTKKEILFGHHFTSIAGTGPIVGPAIGIIWGWVPALLWVFLGSIFMGAVHDFSALIISARKRGSSIGQLCAELINPRVRTLFLLIIFFGLWIVIAIFGLVIAVLFELFPQSVFPVWMEIPIAIWLGYAVYKRGGNVIFLSIIAVILMYITVIIGAYFPLKMPSLFGLSSLTLWIFVLFTYAYIASVLPVWKLLQPRDFINAHELFIVLILLVLGILFAHPQMVAPAINISPKGAPPILPFIFVTIACGAISGFHSLVSSGTSSKQLSNEEDARFIGYGSMLMEGVLAILVIIAVGAGIGIYLETAEGEILKGVSAWNYQYSSWAAAKGLSAKVGAFVKGSANLLSSIGIPISISITIMGVFVASFAGTTLDTATRIQRYVITELATDYNIKFLTTRYNATSFAILSALILAMSQKGGKGGLILWPLFGTTNQLLAGLALLVASIYLFKEKKIVWNTLAPMIFMIFITTWAMVKNLNIFYLEGKWHLFLIGVAILALNFWMIIEAAIYLKAKNKV